MSYQIKLPVFEGPFDLLLFFIERDELDIYDIPLASITNDYLEYIRQMEAMNIELASEFVLVAATLMRLKAKMLLPRKDLDEAGEEIDPRQELVERLIEYKKYKAVVEELKQLEENRSEQYKRGNVQQEILSVTDEAVTGAELQSVTLYKLLNAFNNVLQKMEGRKQQVQHTVINYSYSIKGQKDFLIRFISKRKITNFTDVFGKSENRIHAIFTFLALLELIQQQVLQMKNNVGINDFSLRLTGAVAEL